MGIHSDCLNLEKAGINWSGRGPILLHPVTNRIFLTFLKSERYKQALLISSHPIRIVWNDVIEASIILAAI